jgi:hypothetical protein
MAKENNTGPDKNQEKLFREINKLAKDLNLTEENRINIEKDIADGKLQTLAAIKSTVSEIKKQQVAEQFITKEKQKQRDLINEAKAKAEAAQKIDSISVDIQKDMAKAYKQAGMMSEDQVKGYQERIAKGKEEVDIALALGDITADEAAIIHRGLDARDMELEKIKEILPLSNAMYEEVAKGVDKIKGSFDDFMSHIPGGGVISKALGLDDAFDSLKKEGTKAAAAFTKTIMEGGTAMQGLTAAQGAFNLSALANPYVLLAAAIIGTFVLLTSILSKQTKQYLEQAEAAGNTVAAAKQQVITAKELSAETGNTLSSYEDILEVQNAINEALGDSKMVTAETAMEASNLGKTYGYGAKTAGESTAAFMALGASQEESIELQRQTNVEALKAGVDMGKVQKDIAANAKNVSKYLSGNPKALAEAAIEAQKLGTSLDQMGKIADSLLDIESSMQAQFEFQAMTGKQINLNKARELALAGDIAGATQELMGQIGDINDFENMSVVQRGKLAKMMGMEVDEIEKSLRLQEFRGQLTDDEIAKLSGLNMSAQELANLTAEEAEQKLASLQATEKMKTAFNKMKQTVMNALQPLFEIVGILIDNLMPVFDKIAYSLKVAFMPVKMALEVFKQIYEALQPIRDVFNDFNKQLTGMKSGALDGIFDTFKKILSAVLKPIVMIVKVIAKILSAVIKPVLAVIQFAFDAIAAVLDGIGSAFEYIGGLIEDLFYYPLMAVEAIANAIWDAFTYVGQAMQMAGQMLLDFILLPIKPFIWLFEWLAGGGEDVDANVNVEENGGDEAKTAQDRAASGDVATAEASGRAQSDFQKESQERAANMVAQPFQMGAGAYAEGGTTKAGLALVGEEGPELVQMPGGAHVAPAAPTKEFIDSQGSINSYAEGTSEMPEIQSSGGGTDMSGVISVLQGILSAVQNPPDVVIGEGAVNTIGNKIAAKGTFRV